MDAKPAIISQYQAALTMLKQAITHCPDTLWTDPADKTQYWQVAYHTLFYTHLYLQVSAQEFAAWPGHREHYQFLGALPWPPHDQPKIGAPYSQGEVLAYLEFCQEHVKAKVAELDLEAAASGFSWLPFGKLELQLYNLRHLQHHTGELLARLGARAGVEVDWVVV